MPTIDELRRRLETLADTPSGRTDDDLLEAARDQAAPASRTPRRALAIAAAVLAVGAIAAALLQQAPDDDRSRLSTTPSTVTPEPEPPVAPDLDAARWQQLPHAPAPLSHHVVLVPDGAFAWTVPTEGGTELYDRPLTLGGVAYDETAGAWTEVSRPQQLRAVPRQHGEADTIWTGDEVLLVVPTWSDRTGAAGELTTLRWRPGDVAARLAGQVVIPGDARPEPNLQVTLAMDGGDVLALVTRFGATTQTEPTYRADHQLWRLDLDTDDDGWTRLADPPTTGDRIYGFEATPDGVLVTSSEPPPEGSSFNRYGAVLVHRLDPDGAWRQLSPGPEDLTGQSAGSVWDGERLVVVSYQPSAAALDPSGDAWTELPAPPIDGCEDYPAVLRTGAATVTGYCQRFAMLVDGQDAWLPVPESDDAADRLIAADDRRVLGARWYEATGQTQLVVLRWD